jgi:hypothetical protein
MYTLYRKDLGEAFWRPASQTQITNKADVFSNEDNMTKTGKGK